MSKLQVPWANYKFKIFIQHERYKITWMPSYLEFNVNYFQNTLVIPSASDSLCCLLLRGVYLSVAHVKMQSQFAAITSEFLVIFLTISWGGAIHMSMIIPVRKPTRNQKAKRPNSTGEAVNYRTMSSPCWLQEHKWFKDSCIK